MRILAPWDQKNQSYITLAMIILGTGGRLFFNYTCFCTLTINRGSFDIKLYVGVLDCFYRVQKGTKELTEIILLQFLSVTSAD